MADSDARPAAADGSDGASESVDSTTETAAPAEATESVEAAHGAQVDAPLARLMGAGFKTSRTRKSVFQSLLQARSRYGGKKIAVIDADGRKLSYDDLVKASFALGSALKTGTEKGEVVGLLLPTGAGVIIGFFALSAYGRVPAMLNFTAGKRALSAAMSAAQAKTIVTAHRFIELGRLDALEAELSEDYNLVYLEDVRENLTTGDKISAAIGLVAPWAMRSWSNPDDPAVFLFTSGTEGDPKGVALSHANLIANVEQVRDHIDLLPTDVLFNPMPCFHVFGLTGGVMLPINLGIPAICHPTPLEAKTIVKRVAETQATILFATDTFLNQYARAAGENDLVSLRFSVCGAERVKDETRAAVRKRFDLEIVEGYGVTETAPVIAVNQPGNNHPGTVGQLLPGVEARLERVAGIEDGGRLFVRGPNIMLGYVHTTEPGVIVPPVEGWHDTGDIVAFDEDGYLRIRGRVKRFAKLAGEMVSLAVVENCANSIWPGQLHAAVAVEDTKKGEQILLFTDSKDADRQHIVAFARSHGVSELAIPKRIVHVDEVPVLGTGKLDYNGVNKMARAMVEREKAEKAEKAAKLQAEPAE